ILDEEDGAVQQEEVLRPFVFLAPQELHPRDVHELDRHAVAAGVAVVLGPRVGEANPCRETTAGFREDAGPQGRGEIVGDDELGPDAAMVLRMLTTGNESPGARQSLVIDPQAEELKVGVDDPLYGLVFSVGNLLETELRSHLQDAHGLSSEG